MDSSFFDSSVFSVSAEQWLSLSPFFILFIGIFLSTVLAAFRKGDLAQKMVLVPTLGVSALLFLDEWNAPAQFFLGSSLEIDPTVRIYSVLILFCALFSSLFIYTEEEEKHSEWSLLLLISVLGMTLLLGARNWVAFFVCIETLSIPGYILAALHTRKNHSLEAGLKYLLMGAFASSFLLLGIAIIYGLCGAFDYESIQGVLMDLSSQEKLLVSVATVILLSSFAFKIALIPFHMWAPDIYQGAPTGVAAFLGSTTKLALFGAILMSFERSGFFGLFLSKQFFLLFGALSILVGSLLSLAQRTLKRMLAYSGIVHVGYVSLVAAYGEASLGNVGYYLLVYSLSFIGVLAAVESLSKFVNSEQKDLELAQLAQVAEKAPLSSLIAMAFFLFSLAGIPPLPGFFAKYSFLKELFTKGDFFSFTLILVGSFLGLAYYLRALIPLFFHDKIWDRGALAAYPKDSRAFGWISLGLAVLSMSAIALIGFFAEWNIAAAATSLR
jgi:NADH-quinone oxidoreductase subunit N